MRDRTLPLLPRIPKCATGTMLAHVSRLHGPVWSCGPCAPGVRSLQSNGWLQGSHAVWFNLAIFGFPA
jgi:hypothetical protein